MAQATQCDIVYKLIGKAFIRVTYHNPELPDEAVRMTKTLLLPEYEIYKTSEREIRKRIPGEV